MTASPSESPEPMQWGMIGKDETTTREKLEKYTGEVGWEELRPHYENGALLFVDLSIPIVDAGLAIANDDIDRVAEWRGNGDLVNPSDPHAEYWKKSGARFRALVVSPFVLIQELPAGSADDSPA